MRHESKMRKTFLGKRKNADADLSQHKTNVKLNLIDRYLQCTVNTRISIWQNNFGRTVIIIA